VKSVCVFCGSSAGIRREYADATRELARILVRDGRSAVFGGGNIGLMGVLADAVLAAGGKITGVIPRALVDRELAHHGVTALRIVDTMHERKALMAHHADAFVALPGGIGTMEELFEVFSWASLGIHAKPFGLLNVLDYFSPLVGFLDRAVAEGFLAPRYRDLLHVDASPGALLERLARCHSRLPLSAARSVEASDL
jgi:hypothetical protein